MPAGRNPVLENGEVRGWDRRSNPKKRKAEVISLGLQVILE
jgi:hypothetical protein